MNFEDRNVLVTGGAGFIGSEMIRQLLDNKANVTILDNFASGKKEYIPSNKKLKIIKGDIIDEKDVKKAVKDQEVIYNLAALPFIPDSYHYPVDFFKTNTIGNLNVLWESIKSKSIETFIQISTSEVYGSAQYSPMDENHPTAPFSTYAVSKLAADRAAYTLHKENGVPVVVIRPFNTYGPRYTQPYIIPEIINQLLNGVKELSLGNINATRDFTFVSDTVNGFLKAANEKKAIGEIINIGSRSEIKMQTLAEKIIKISGKNVKIKIDESRLRPNDVNRLICDNKKAKKLLKWNPTISMDEGLKITYDWSKKNKVDFNAPFKRWYYKK
jgi:dTDP-glucose 4,6-dehydratase